MYGCCVVVLNEISFSATLLTGCLSEGKIEKCVYTVYNKRGKKSFLYIPEESVFVTCVWFRCDVECFSFVSFFPKPHVSTPTLLPGFLHVSWDLHGQTNIQQTILLGGREVSEIWTSQRVHAGSCGKRRENRITAYEPRRSYNIHSGLTCHSVKKGKSCQGALPP